MAQKTVLFDAGHVTRTPGAMLALVRAATTESSIVERHQSGDWGDVGESDRHCNNLALKRGGRIASAYQLRTGEKVLVITEADRGTTTLLLAFE